MKGWFEFYLWYEFDNGIVGEGKSLWVLWEEEGRVFEVVGWI